MPVLYCICAWLLLLAAPAAAQTPAPAAKTGYNVFLRGSSIGREDVTVTTDATGTTFTSEGRLSAPVNAVMQRAEVKYSSDWSPISFEYEGNINYAEVMLHTTFANGTAATSGKQGVNTVAVSQAVDPHTVVLPNGMFGAYAALTRRLSSLAAGADLHAYLLPIGEAPMHLDSVSSERMQTGTSIFNVKRYALTVATAPTPSIVSLIAGEDGSLLRVTIPSQALDVLREDLAASMSRTQIFSNPGDEAVLIPAPGFNLGATITHPRSTSARTGAVVLVSGSASGDRDGTLFGVPMLGQLAGAIADAGLVALRYDKRGYGQSGGRAESATLNDYADDVRVIVKWLAARKDIDPKRIAVVGYSEGSMIAFMAAAHEKRIAAVVSLDGPAATGSQQVLEEQQRALDAAKATPEERQAKVALEKQILSAVSTGQGWQGIPPDLRRQADTPWFQSLIAYDPARELDHVRQPILIVHGELDREVPASHAEQLAAVAHKVSDSRTIDVVVVPGVNHLLVPAATGEVGEYVSLKDRSVSPEVSKAVTGWLTKTLQTVK